MAIGAGCHNGVAAAEEDADVPDIVVIHIGSFTRSPEGAVVPKEGEELAENIIQAEGCALPLQGDVAENINDTSFLNLALS